LLKSVLAQAASSGARYFLGYGRLPMFHQSPDIDVDSYLRLTRDRISPWDSQLGFYWSIGAHPVRSCDGRYRYVPIPGSMRQDPESRGHGVFILAPLDGSVFPFEKLAP
jgi:hypothetical protein